MRLSKAVFVVLTGFLLLFLLSAKDDSLAACTPPVKIVGSTYAPTSIQDAYDYASNDLGLSDFTLRLAGEIFTENLTLDGGSVMLDGGYDCSFSIKNSTSGIFGSVTIGTGSLNWAGGVGVKSTDQCAFDLDSDGFTAFGSCSGSANDCNDNNPNISPAAPEICDGIDNNCDGQIDEGLTPIDVDGDGYYAFGSCGAVADDCNDNNASIHPGALDIPYDGIDQDCSGADLTFPGEVCVNCHAPESNWPNLHNLTTPPDGTCATCHAPQVSNILSGHYGNKVLTAGNNMAAGSTISCTSCHDADSSTHSGGVTLGNGTNFVATKVLAVWPNTTCDTCHENRASQHVTASAHNNRIIDTTCIICHTSDTTVLGQPGNGTLASAADVDALHRSDCALCHNYAGGVLNAGTVRQVIQQGLSGVQVSCLDCHTDKKTGHGAFTHPVAVGPNDLSYDAPGTLCSNCHVVANWAQIEGIEHNVATNGTGSCTTCHNSPRQEVIDAIALGANPTNCLDCHSDKQLTPHGGTDHLAFGYVTGGSTSCMVCHDPGTAADAPVGVIHHNNCTLCHTTVPNLQPGVPAGGGDCATCHTNTWEATHSVATPVHNSLVQVATTSCADCHDNTLVSGAVTTHNGCSSCHNTDGSLRSLAVGKTFTSGGDCTTCHTGSWDTLHAAAPDHTSLVRVSTTICASCHDNTLVSGAANTHNGCASCHNTDGSLRSLAVGKNFTAGGDCTTCHGAGWETTHTTHTHTVALGSGDLSGGAPCGNCHVVANWTQIEGTTHNVATNGTGSCATCHNSPRQEVIDAIATGANPTNCLDCHSTKTSAHANIDHATLGYVTGGTTSCMSCHDPGTAVNGTVTVTHGSNCNLCHTTVPNLQPGIPAGGGDCATCHTNTWVATHSVATPDHSSLVQVATTSCADCHDNTLVSGAANTHNGCASCHNTDGSLRSLAVGKNFTTGGNCTTCHTGSWAATHSAHSHTVALGSSDLSNGSSCGSCHSVANWTQIEGTTHNVATNGTGSCATCHNSPRQAVMNAIATGANPTNCLDCHGDKTSAHGSVNHVASGYVTGGSTICMTCHDPGTAANATVTVTHNGNCSLCHTTVPNLQPGVPSGGGDCATCHGSNVDTIHTSCTTCHGQPPNGSSFPNTTGAHDAHAALGFGSVNPSCGACHNGATHNNGTADVGILSNFDAKSGPASSNGSTCSSTRCHGGQTTPAWATGSINVNTQCTSCHQRSTAQYNGNTSGRHGTHSSRSCTDCHNTTTLAIGHFSNLETSTFEQDPADTIGGGSTRVGSYNGSSCSNIQCHGSENW